MTDPKVQPDKELQPKPEDVAAKQRAAFEAIRKKSAKDPEGRGHGKEPEHDEEKPPGFVKAGKAPPEEEPEEKQETPPEQPKEDLGEKKPAKRSKEAVRAINYLRLKGLSEKALDALSDDEIADMRSRILERESKFDDLLATNAELKAKLKEQAAKEPEPNAVPAVPLDLKSKLAPLKEELSEEALAALEATLEGVYSAQQKELEALRKEQNENLSAQKARQKAEAERVLAAAREEVGERFPALADDNVFEEVQETMEALTASPHLIEGAKTADELMRKLLVAASRALSLDEVTSEDAAQKRKEASEERDRRANGQFAPTSKKRDRPLTTEERQKAVFDHIRKHKVTDRTERIWGAKKAGGY